MNKKDVRNDKKALNVAFKEFESGVYSGTDGIYNCAAGLKELVQSSYLSDASKKSYCDKIDRKAQKLANNKNYTVTSKGKIPKACVITGLGFVGVVTVVGLYSIIKKSSSENLEAEKNGFNTFKLIREIDTEIDELEETKEIPYHLYFDPNDNQSLIDQSVAFIANSLPCGVDFSSQKDISKYMDFYLVTNIDSIDPMDLARLGYYAKTTQSIMDNYQYCINQIATDLLTVTPETMLDYNFIAEKDSREILMQLQTLIAQYNVTEDKKEKEELAESIETLLYDNFTLQDGRSDYSHVTYEIIGRFAKSADLILPNGLSKELTEILCEDLDNCFAVVADGDKKKSERAQAETAVRDTLDDKLAIAREYRNQDLSTVSEIELLTGSEVEQIIYDQVKLMNQEFISNPTFTHEGKETSTRGTKTVDSVTLSNGELISEEEVKELGLNPATVTPEQYESAVVQQFEQEAQKDFEEKATQAKVDASNAFFDGYNGVPAKYPNDELYMKNYNEGKNSRPSETTKTEYVDVPDQVIENNSTITEEGYKEDINTNQNTNSDGQTNFVPVENTTTENVGETITEEGYIETETHFEPVASTLSQLKAMRATLDTIMAQPTVYYDHENALFAFENDVYDLSKQSIKM